MSSGKIRVGILRCFRSVFARAYKLEQMAIVVFRKMHYICNVAYWAAYIFIK